MKYRRQAASAILVMLIAGIFVLGGRIALAAGSASQTSSSGSATQVSVVKLSNPLGTDDFNQLAATIVTNILGFIGTISLVLFIYGGLVLMTSAGAPAKIEKGKNVLLYAIIGMIIVFFSYMLVKVVIEGITGNA
jgi:peptidoglycan/LPS O-acetylase OafA/YrhL